MKELQLTSTIKCPACSFRSVEIMPIDACIYYFDCPSCAAKLTPKPGDCCVFCSYGDFPCPPVQDSKSCGLSQPAFVKREDQ
jgi:hypothetical protein